MNELVKTNGRHKTLLPTPEPKLPKATEEHTGLVDANKVLTQLTHGSILRADPADVVKAVGCGRVTKTIRITTKTKES